jgi:uncharacterized protein
VSTLAQVLEAHDVALAVVFGSRARGRARPDSDVDVGVLRRDERALTFRELADLTLALQTWRRDADQLPGPLAVFGEGEIDVADLSSKDAIFRFNVARDARVVHADSRHRWVEWLTRTLIDYDDMAHYLPMLVAGVERAATNAVRP